MIENIDEIREKADILTVVEYYLPLQKSNGLYKCCCPFHEEKTPSFILNVRKNYYYCFGCNQGGDSFAFISKYKHLDFNEAVKEVANICKIDVKEGVKAIKNELFYKLLAKINEIAKARLKENESLKDELRARGLKDDEFSDFDLGFFDTLFILKELDKSELEMALNLGIFAKGKDNSYYSIFSKRLSIALRDAQHRIIGFSSRITKAFSGFKNEAKYINSKESFLFKKATYLYNLSRAKSAINKEKEVIIAEGFFDVFALIKMGFKNVVATCGTAFTLSHLSLLKKFDDELCIVLFFDKDNAGENANLKALELCFKASFFNIKVRVIKARCKDMAELILLKGDKDIKELLHDYTGLEYYIKLRLLRANNKAKAKDELLEDLKELFNAQSFYLRAELIKEACLYLNCDEAVFNKKQGIKKIINTSLEKSIIKSIINDESFAFIASEYLNGDEFVEFRQDYINFIKSKSLNPALQKLALDESILELDRNKFALALKSLKKRKLQEELEQARLSKNINLIIELNERLKNLS